MFCSRCGRPVAPDAAFCNACGAPVVKAPEGNGPGAAPVARVAVPLARPGAITALAVIQFLSAGFLLLLAIFALAAGLFASQDPMAVLVALVFGALAVPQLFCGVGLLRLKPYGRTLQLVLWSPSATGRRLGCVERGAGPACPGAEWHARFARPSMPSRKADIPAPVPAWT
jgi:hypothetical protein